MKIKKSFIIILLLLFSSLTAYAETDPVYPPNCTTKMISFQGNNLILGIKATDRQHRAYVLYNASSTPILVRHISDGELLSLPMPSIVQPNKWTAILLEENYFPMSCQEYSDYGRFNVPCSSVIKACELAVSPVMLSAQGEYWITENDDSFSSLFKGIRGEGIYP